MSIPPPLAGAPIPNFALRRVTRVLAVVLTLGVFAWAPFAWSAVRQRSKADAFLATVLFTTAIYLVSLASNEGNDLAFWTVLLILMPGGSVLAARRTPRTATVPAGSRARATSLIAVGAVVYFVAAGAFAPSEPPNQDETTPPASSPAPSLSSESEPTAAVTESVTPPDVAPETEEAEEPDAPKAEEDDNGGTGGRDFDGQVGIQFGYACSPVGALGIAEDGRPAKCFMGKDGRARWGYDSNRG
ncbi:hypothetical protein [Streptomyces sp. NPDC002845]